MNSPRSSKSRPLDPRKLDIEAMARDAQQLSGKWPASDFERLAEAGAAEVPVRDWPPVQWSARAEQRQQRGAEPQIWLHLQAQARAHLSCQRCLQPVEEDLVLDRWFHFVRDEELAASLDAESEDDVLSLGGRLDLLDLIEDELLLALPLVPRHEHCPQPLQLPDTVAELPVEQDKPNPFAVLAALKKSGGNGPGS